VSERGELSVCEYEIEREERERSVCVKEEEREDIKQILVDLFTLALSFSRTSRR